MKLNTLLLTSAATLMATTVAFAADLPSKKAAPALGAVQVCKVGGMTGFTLPGSDTCLQISGRVTVDLGNGDLDEEYFGEDGYALGNAGGYNYRLNFDARSNSEIGVVRSFVSLTGDTSARKAFIQAAGFTAGLKDSLADIAGTQGNQYGSFWGQSGVGIDYQAAVGGISLGIGLEDANITSVETADRADMLVSLGASAGGVNFKVVGVSNDVDGVAGSAILGQISAKVGPADVYAFGGTAEDAVCYVFNHPVLGCVDSHGEATSFGGGVTFNVAPTTSITLEGVSGEAYGTDYSSVGLFMSHAVTKNLSIQPEVVMTEAHGSDNTAAFIRIKRDF